jgi:hypothetical protein
MESVNQELGKTPATTRLDDLTPLLEIIARMDDFVLPKCRQGLRHTTLHDTPLGKKEFSASVHRQGTRQWSLRQELWLLPAGADLRQVRSARRPP